MPEAVTTTTETPVDPNTTQQALNAVDPGAGDVNGNVPAAEPAPEPTPATPAAAPAAGADDKPKTTWFQKRIDALTAEKHQERREKEALKQQTEALLSQLADARKTGAPAPTPGAAPAGIQPPAAAAATPPQPNLSETEIEARALRKADEIAQQRAFNKACNDTYSAGKEEFDDFDRTINTFSMFGGIPNNVLDIVTEMPKGHAVLYALGKDPDLIERITKMPPAKQALELARLESSIAKPVSKPISGAPAPVTPIDGSGRVEADPEKMSMEDFVAWRAKTARKK